jgi:hypothetical protein
VCEDREPTLREWETRPVEHEPALVILNDYANRIADALGKVGY